VNSAAGRPIVDAHHHLWDLASHEYDWLVQDGWPAMTELLGDYSSIRRPFLIDELESVFRANGVGKSVHVQADWVGDPVDETRWLQSIADRHGYPNGIVAFTDLTQRWAPAELERHCKSPNMRGVRMTHRRHHPDLLIDLSFRRNFAHLARLGLSYDISVTAARMPQALDLASAFPDTHIVLAGLAIPSDGAAESRERWRFGLRLLAQAPNVAVKCTALGVADHSWMTERIRPWIREAADLFGPERLLFGSNWPVDGLYSSYGRILNAYREILADLTSDELDGFFAGNAEALYRL